MTEAVIFDIGNVSIEWSPERHCDGTFTDTYVDSFRIAEAELPFLEAFARRHLFARPFGIAGRPPPEALL